jgi:GNAT superfamily N-acetyltransferase
MRAQEFVKDVEGIDVSLEIQKDDAYVDDDDTDNQVVFVKATSNGKELGHVLFTMSYDGQGLILNPQDLEVDERYRGQGIAKIMYDFVKSKGYRIRRSGQQTDAGAAFWQRHRPGQNVWEDEYTGEYTFDIPKRPMNARELIKRGAIFVVDPHGDNGWEPDAEGFSLVTLHNYYFGDPWCKESKQHLKPEAYPGAIHALKDPEELKKMSDQKYKQILWSIKKLGIPEQVAFLDTVAENFADGKVKGKSRPGRVKRAGASCNGSVTDLRRKAKNASGERAKMYHWCANMKSGRAKKNK